MFVLYPPAEDSRGYQILTRPKRIRLATMCNNESAWAVPRTVNADDYL
jgi:hypothetical protein